jgi:hypothetical protein
MKLAVSVSALFLLIGGLAAIDRCYRALPLSQLRRHQLGDDAHTDRRLLLDPRTIDTKPKDPMPFRLPERARTWCSPPAEPRLPQGVCTDFDVINEVEMGGGLTNALKVVLLGAIRSYEEKKCFYIKEDLSHLVLRKDSKNSIGPSFINRYFEPIGLSANNPQVLLAQREGRIEKKDFLRETWTDPLRRIAGTKHNIAALQLYNVDGHDLKRMMLRQIWRPLPHVREQTCRSLEAHGLEDDYLAFSVRRGDKDTEKHTTISKTEEYIAEAESVIRDNFGGLVPRIFVATDDCDVMGELRALRPEWTFESECDNVSSHGGFAIGDMAEWTPAETDAHFMKFFVELYGIVAAKIVIGVAYTNVSWWAYFMRQGEWSEYKMLDILGKEKNSLAVW